MATFIGLDGIPGGWVAVDLDEHGRHRFDYANRADHLLAVSYDRAMIDVPIGLPEQGYRACDIAARKLVGSRVFLGARWNVWAFESYEHANAHYWRNNDTGIAKQLWCIRDKLREINELMTPDLQERLQETHPALIFRRLNNYESLDNKKTVAGRAQRIALLKRHGFDQIDTWLDQRRGTAIRPDDLIDACACALAARESNQRTPEGDPLLERGIRMEMWF
jgi:predicted RNase H-like nuclease